MTLEEAHHLGSLSGLEETIKSETSNNLLEQISDWYFEPKHFEKNGKIYENVGIKKFKKQLLKATRYMGRKKENELHGTNYFVGSDFSAESLKRFENATRRTEIVHTLMPLPAAYMSAVAFANDYYVFGIACAVAVLPNLYLIGLQRYNRAKVYGRLERLAVRQNDKTQ